MTDLVSFRTSDIEKILKDLNEKSTSIEKIKSNLKQFLVYSFENKDIANEIIGNRAVTVLVELYNSERGKTLRGHISCILLFLSFEGSGCEEGTVLNVAITALSNIFNKSDASIFLECASGIMDLTTFSNSPSSITSSSNDEPHSPPTHFLSVFSSTLLFEKTSELLSSPTLAERAKVDVLDVLVKLSDAGLMNEAAAFVAWLQSQSQPNGSGEVGGSGGGGGDGGGGERVDCGVSVTRFVKAFNGFTESVKKISLVKKKSALRSLADDVYRSIQERTFFPSVSVGFSNTAEPGSKPAAPFGLPLEFLPNSAASHVTLASSKSVLTWNSDAYATLFVNPEISKGIYKIKIQLISCTYREFGVSTKSAMASFAQTYLGKSLGACAIRECGIRCGGSYVVQSTLFSNQVNDDVSLALELNADTHVLYFFVNDVQVPHSVVNVPPSVHFGVSGMTRGGVFKLLMLAKLTAPSIDTSVVCSTYNWK